MRRIGTLFVLSAVAVIGCSQQVELEGVVTAKGKVTQGGAPLAGATITFSPTSGGRAASATTDENGEFALTTLTAGDGAMPGDYAVTVTKTETIGKEYTEEEANEYYSKHQTQPPAPEVKNVVDKKYASPATSGLAATVPDGGISDLSFEVE